MDESSSGFGDESPILFKYPRRLYKIQNSNDVLTIEDFYKELLSYLKKSKSFTKKELKSFWEQINNIEAEDQKTRWLLKKIRGLLMFILKKRSDFQSCIGKGKIVIYEQSDFSQNSVNTSVSATPNVHNRSDDVPVVPSCLLTNNNFVSMEVNESENASKHETENYSQDLFNSDTMENLHLYAQENFQMFKTLTQNSSTENEDESQIFKVPVDVKSKKIENVYQLHEKLEDNYKSLVSLTPSLESDPKMTETLPNEMLVEDGEPENTKTNIFDDLMENNESMKEDFKHALEKTEKWVSEIISGLMKLDVRQNRKSRLVGKDSPNTSFESTSSGSEGLKPYYSEENFKTIRETVLKFKENLKNKKNLKVLKDFDYNF